MSDLNINSTVFCYVIIVDEIEFSEKIGQKIRELRLQRRLSQFDLSIECGIPKNQIGRIERNTISPTLKTIIKICNGLNIHPKELFDLQ